MSNQEKNKLETEFEELIDQFKSKSEKALALINDKLKESIRYLDEAVALSEKEGIPFSTTISFIDNDYNPKSFTRSEFKDLDRYIISDICGTNSDPNYYGWEHSAIC